MGAESSIQRVAEKEGMYTNGSEENRDVFRGAGEGSIEDKINPAPRSRLVTLSPKSRLIIPRVVFALI